MNKKGASARSEVRDTLTYFEAATASNSALSKKEQPNRNRKWDTDTSSAGSGTSSSRGGRSSRVISRHASSNSLLRPRLGLDPNALFSVAAIATAPAGTTVIESEAESEAERSEVEAEWMEMKASVTRFFVINMNQNDRHAFIFIL